MKNKEKNDRPRKKTVFQVFMEVNNLKGRDLAKLMGCSEQNISQIKRGRQPISKDILFQLKQNKELDTSMLDEKSEFSPTDTSPSGDIVRILLDKIDRLSEEVWIQRKEIAEIREFLKTKL